MRQIGEAINELVARLESGRNEVLANEGRNDDAAPRDRHDPEGMMSQGVRAGGREAAYR